MSLRCGCPDAADDIVFGPAHQCSVDASVRVERATPMSEMIAAFRSARAMVRQDFTLSPPEPRYMETLDEDERTGH